MTPVHAHTRAVETVALFLVLVSFACDVRAARVFVGIIEADSYQSVIYGASAFSRIADLPVALEVINDELMRRLALPSFEGVSSTDTLRIVQTADGSKPLDEDNPSNVAIIPLSDMGTASLAAFSAAYAKRSSTTPPFVFFEQPKDTNRPPFVATALSGHHLLTSTSRDAITWAWENRARLIDAPSQTIPGTIRMFVNPQRFADVLGTRSQKAASVINLDKLIRDFDTLSFSLNLESQSMTLSLRGKPLADSPLQTLLASLRPPALPLWNGTPDTAFFTSFSASGNPKLWEPYLGQSRFHLLNLAADLVPPDAFTGEQILYLAPPHEKQGLCLVQISPLKDADAVRQAIQKLHTVKTDDGIELVRQPTRRSADLSIETYDIKISSRTAAAGKGKADEPSVWFTVASLFLKHAVLETAVKDGHLLTVLGPANTIEGELPVLAFRDKPLTLQRQIAMRNPTLDATLTMASSLNAANLLCHIATIIPGVKPEQLRALSASGDGANFGLCQNADRTLTASLSVNANEIAALQRINRDGREVLQELFFQMFTSQMMNLEKSAAPANALKP